MTSPEPVAEVMEFSHHWDQPESVDPTAYTATPWERERAPAAGGGRHLLARSEVADTTEQLRRAVPLDHHRENPEQEES